MTSPLRVLVDAPGLDAALVAASDAMDGDVVIWVTTEGGAVLAGVPDDAAQPVEVPTPGGATIHVVADVADVADDPTILLLAAVVDRILAADGADALRARMVAVERIGRIGSYDWHTRTDVNDWSDELFRIYGHEPGAFNASYEQFMSMLHPDDRDRIRELHAHAYQTGEPFEMEERIVRPDGEERILWSNGEVVMGPDGTPERMIGVCRDVTDERRTAKQVTASAAQFRTIVESAPDAIIVVDGSGTITTANAHVGPLLGYAPEELVGRPIEELVPLEHRGAHVRDRSRFLAAPTTRPMGAGQDLAAQHRDGHLVPVDIALAPLPDGEGRPEVVAFVRDASVRRTAEHARRREALVESRRRQALELNDQVVQGLVALLWRLDRDDVTGVRVIAERTLAAARAVLRDLLGDDAPDTQPGGLVRSAVEGPATAVVAAAQITRAPDDRVDGAVRVLIADDDPDLRLLLGLHLGQEQAVRVVAEAANGEEAVDQAVAHRPDVVLLDMSMPKVDGLQAAQRIRAALPDVRIVVLSGYPADRMEDVALAAGADAYLEKRAELRPVLEAILAVVGAR